MAVATRSWGMHTTTVVADPPHEVAAATTARRLVGVDALRGAVLALMLLTPVTGEPGGSYPLLAHAPWDGFTVADAILPAFLVTSGASLALLLRGPVTPPIRLRLLRRLLALLVLGVLYNAAGQPFDAGQVRLTGVLQIIGLSGAVAAAIILAVRRLAGAATPDQPRALLPVAAAAIVLPLVYGVTLARGASRCAPGLPGCNPWHAVDVSLLGAGRVYGQGTLGYDPEGVAVTVVAAALVLFGYVALTWLHGRGVSWWSIGVVAAAGLGLLALGVALDAVQPVNKRLHTPAFTFLAGGIGVLGLAVALALWDGWVAARGRWSGAVRGARAVTAHPLVTLGRNALVVYLAERVLLVTLASTEVAGVDGPRTLQQVLVGDWLAVEGARVHLAYTALLLTVVVGITYGMRALRWRVTL